MKLKINFKKYVVIVAVLFVFSQLFFHNVADFVSSTFTKEVSMFLIVYGFALLFFEKDIENFFKRKKYDTKAYDDLYNYVKENVNKNIVDKYTPLENFITLLKSDAQMIIFSMFFYSLVETLIGNKEAYFLSFLIFSLSVYGFCRSGLYLFKNYKSLKNSG